MQISAQASAAPLSSVPPVVSRPLANYHPSIWGNHFLLYNSDPEHLATKKQLVEKLKEETRKELNATANKPSHQLKLIDAIQRLGLAYHFEIEIEEALQNLYKTYKDWIGNANIYTAALGFRLFRQQGFNISCDIFNKYMDEKMDFDLSLIDGPGFLALYEATYLRKHGEDVLEQALAFTTDHLKSMANDSTNPLAKRALHTLKRPLRKGLPRLEARHCISFYEDDDLKNDVLMKLAKLDYNLLQSFHKEELREMARWWHGLNFAMKLPFARDRLVEDYFWALGVYFEPKYSIARKIFTKIIAMASVIDDIYDAYGTFEELELFTKAIERWNINSLNQLPEYMKFVYQALLDVYEEIEEQITRDGALYQVHYAKKAMKILVRGYFAEAKWLRDKYMPTMEEYMHTALMSSAYTTLTAASFVGMGELVTKESFDWVFSKPKIVRASSVICRLMDDMVSEFEQMREHIPSAVELYTKEHGVSKEQVHKVFKKQVEDAWLDINEELLEPTTAPRPLLLRVLNLSRVIDVIYKEEDEYTNVGKDMKNNILALLVDPVPE